MFSIMILATLYCIFQMLSAQCWQRCLWTRQVYFYRYMSKLPRKHSGHFPPHGRGGLLWAIALYLMVLFPVRTNPRWRPPPSWKNFKRPYLRNRSSDPLHVWFYSVIHKIGTPLYFCNNFFKCWSIWMKITSLYSLRNLLSGDVVCNCIFYKYSLYDVK